MLTASLVLLLSRLFPLSSLSFLFFSHGNRHCRTVEKLPGTTLARGTTGSAAFWWSYWSCHIDALRLSRTLDHSGHSCKEAKTTQKGRKPGCDGVFGLIWCFWFPCFMIFLVSFVSSVSFGHTGSLRLLPRGRRMSAHGIIRTFSLATNAGRCHRIRMFSICFFFPLFPLLTGFRAVTSASAYTFPPSPSPGHPTRLAGPYILLTKSVGNRRPRGPGLQRGDQQTERSVRGTRLSAEGKGRWGLVQGFSPLLPVFLFCPPSFDVPFPSFLMSRYDSCCLLPLTAKKKQKKKRTGGLTARNGFT